MFEIVFLGTSASAPSIHRGLSAQVVMRDAHRFLIDCGEGTQRQILRSGLGFKRLNKILLTHGHLDHILGLGGLTSTLARWEAMEAIDIWGGRWTLERVSDLLFGVVLQAAKLPVDIRLHELGAETIFADGDFTLSAFPVSHRGADAFGFLFEEASRRPFLNELATELGVPSGPERRDLVAGKAITLADGRTIQPEQVLGEAIPGTRMVYIGDVGEVDSLRDIVQGADTLVIEATYLDIEADMARKFGHMTARKAAEFARDAGVGNLILTHLSRRYRERDIINEAREVFPGALVARDFDHYQVKRNGELVKVEPESA